MTFRGLTLSMEFEKKKTLQKSIIMGFLIRLGPEGVSDIFSQENKWEDSYLGSKSKYYVIGIHLIIRPMQIKSYYFIKKFAPHQTFEWL